MISLSLEKYFPVSSKFRWLNVSYLKTSLLAAMIALCAEYSTPSTSNTTSANVLSCSSAPKSFVSVHSGTTNFVKWEWPWILTESWTTETSQNSVNWSFGRRPFDSSIRKSRRINFLKPQSFPEVRLISTLYRLEMGREVYENLSSSSQKLVEH